MRDFGLRATSTEDRRSQFSPENPFKQELSPLGNRLLMAALQPVS